MYISMSGVPYRTWEYYPLGSIGHGPLTLWVHWCPWASHRPPSSLSHGKYHRYNPWSIFTNPTLIALISKPIPYMFVEGGSPTTLYALPKLRDRCYTIDRFCRLIYNSTDNATMDAFECQKGKRGKASQFVVFKTIIITILLSIIVKDCDASG